MLAYLVAFSAGLLSFLSPCVLPLVPPYLCFLGGATFDQLSGEDETPSHVYRTIVLSSLAFVLGFTTVFVTLGALPLTGERAYLTLNFGNQVVDA